MKSAESSPVTSSSAVAHAAAWLGIPVYVGFYILAGISAAGAAGPNHSARFWSTVLTTTPLIGAAIAFLAIYLSKSSVGRLTAIFPLLAYMIALALITKWQLDH